MTPFGVFARRSRTAPTRPRLVVIEGAAGQGSPRPAVLSLPRWLRLVFTLSVLAVVVSVALDLVQRIEANLIMRNYKGFLGGSS